MERQLSASAAGRAVVAGGPARAALDGAFEDAAASGALLSLSEHEGFCIPMLEAVEAALR